MNALIAISSWPTSAINGDHQASRDTWLRDIRCYARDVVDYRFFMGDGTPFKGNPELDQAWHERLSHYGDKAGESFPVNYDPLPDEVLLPIPWDFKHMALKSREICCWALANGYEYVFKVDTDTYIDVPRLLASGYEERDYVGFPFARDGWVQASGGAGYWLSRKAMQIVADAEVNMAYEDTWVGLVLRQHGILLHQDARYRVCWPHNHSEGPRPDNDSITSHLGFSPEPFDRQEMYAAHRLRMGEATSAKG